MPDELQVVQIYRKFKRANDHALVVLAMKIPYWLIRRKGRYWLCVRQEEDGFAIRQQLKKYDLENANWPPKAMADLPHVGNGTIVLFFYILILTSFFIAQQSTHIESAGAMIRGKFIVDGDWWRPFTALTLHADIGHLIGNIVSGVCFGLVVNWTFGSGLGWLMILLSGGLGNVLTAHFAGRGDTIISLGASTAVFAALGLLVGHALASNFSPNGLPALRYRLAPLAAGLILLFTLGVGDERTDVAAHFFGFLAGIGFGAMGERLTFRHHTHLSANGHRLCHLLSLTLLATAWVSAAIVGG